MNWIPVANKKVTAYIDTIIGDNEEHIYHEFVVGSFNENIMINCLLRHRKTDDMLYARYVYEIRNFFFHKDIEIR